LASQPQGSVQLPAVIFLCLFGPACFVGGWVLRGVNQVWDPAPAYFSVA
jgi:hypothetical protein